MSSPLMVCPISFLLALLGLNSFVNGEVGWANGHDDEVCLVQGSTLVKRKLLRNTLVQHDVPVPFSYLQKQCISKYISKVGVVMPSFGEHLKSRTWGGVCQPAVLSSESRLSKRIINAGHGSTATRSLHKLFLDFGLKSHHCWSGEAAPKEFWQQSASQVHDKAYINDLKFMTKYPPVSPKVHPPKDLKSCAIILNRLDFGQPFNSGVEAISDTPVANLFLDFFSCSPSAKVFLTTRNSTDWVASRLSHQYAPIPVQSNCGIGLHETSQSLSAQLFDLHNELVRCIVPEENLMVIDVLHNDTNTLPSKIADFLELNASGMEDMSYPHVG